MNHPQLNRLPVILSQQFYKLRLCDEKLQELYDLEAELKNRIRIPPGRYTNSELDNIKLQIPNYQDISDQIQGVYDEQYRIEGIREEILETIEQIKRILFINGRLFQEEM
jgi:hypothetical protein